MSDMEQHRTPEHGWQTTENLKLLKQFIKLCSADPERCPNLDAGGMHVLVPPDEPRYARLREANLRIAEKLTREGSEFDFWVMGTDGRAEVVSALSVAAPRNH